MAVNVLTVIGTRPEAIKMLPVVMAMHRSRHLNPIVVSTGQHGPMVREVLALGEVDVDVDLNVVSTGSLNALVGDVIREFDSLCRSMFDTGGRVHALDATDVFEHGFPGGTLVHGDTSSAMAAALASFHLRIPVAHIEAGLRTGLSLSPYPEEMNRQVISRLASFHLAPTSANEQHLVREGIDAEQIFVTGNTGIDTLMIAAGRPTQIRDSRLAEIVEGDRPIIVVTAHRRENWGGGLARIGEGIRLIVQQHPDVRVVLVTHPNPDARAEVSGPVDGLDQVLIVDPLDYTTFAKVMAAARFAISDSGGVQEEAPALRTPVLVARESTERVEGINAGTLRLVGTDPHVIAEAAHLLLVDDDLCEAMASIVNPYGDGLAAQRVVQALEHLAGRAVEPSRFGSGFDRLKVLRAGGYPGDTVVAIDDPDGAGDLAEGTDAG
jgi:UDP-N-acetylglucosamine 2-epimerase (non-hydrolysing)